VNSGRPLGFAHRGARAQAPENTLRAFRLALDLGSPGLETDVWLTQDGVAVLHHGRTWRRREISTLAASALPTWVPRLAELFEHCGTDFDLSLDLKDETAAEAILAVTRAAGHDPARLWLCGRGLRPLTWRHLDPDVRLVSDTRAAHLRDGWPAHLERVRSGGGDAINLRRRRWSRALIDLVHGADLLAFGWDAQSVRRIRALLALGCDAVYSDHVDRMVLALGDRPPPAG